jgi:hypothetical protein
MFSFVNYLSCIWKVRILIRESFAVVCGFSSLAVTAEVSLRVVKKENTGYFYIPSNSLQASPVSCVASSLSLQPVTEFTGKVCVSSL